MSLHIYEETHCKLDVLKPEKKKRKEDHLNRLYLSGFTIHNNHI